MPYLSFQNPISQFNRIGTSISRWCSSNCCPIPEPPPCGMQSAPPSSLLVTQDMGFSVEAGGVIPFSGPAIVSGDCFLCEEEYLQFLNEREEARLERRGRWRRRRNCKCKCKCQISNCDKSDCPDFELCCLPIIDEETPASELCMCGCCNQLDRTECYHFEYGNIFVAPGVYLIEYTILLSGAPFTTELHLTANGEIIPGSELPIQYLGITTRTETMRVLYEATEPTQISLISTDAFSIPDEQNALFVSMNITGMC